MSITETGEFIRENEAPGVGENAERQEQINQARELAARQDEAPETEGDISANRKAEIRKRLLGE